jgi:hypothetical protein
VKGAELGGAWRGWSAKVGGDLRRYAVHREPIAGAGSLESPLQDARS